MPSGPGKVQVPYFRYRLFFEDGSEAGEASYAVMIRPGELIHVNGGEKLRVLDVAAVEEDEDESAPYVGLLKVAPYTAATGSQM